MRAIDKILACILAVETTWLICARIICRDNPKPDIFDALPFASCSGHTAAFNLFGTLACVITLFGIIKLCSRGSEA